jgi:hypothetical protein
MCFVVVFAWEAPRGGRLHTDVIADTTKVTLRAIVNETLEKGSIVSTDEYHATGDSRADR